jgi:hypothetical protein
MVRRSTIGGEVTAAAAGRGFFLHHREEARNAW